MKKFIFIAIILIGTVSSLTGQLTITSTSPSTGIYTSCSNSNTTCSGTPYYGATIRMKIFNISANSIAFMIAKCDGGSFSTSGTVYLRNGSVCGSSIISAGYSSGVTSKSLTYTFTSAGTYTIYGTTTTSGGANYYTNPITVVVSAPKLAVPTPTSGSNISNSQFTANWSSVSGASYYNVKVKNCADATYNNTATYTSYSNSYTFSNLSCGGCYQYQVQAVGSSGNTSDYSSSGPTVQLTQCNVPSSSGVSFSSITTNSFRANWPSVSGASGYEVNYTTCNGSYTSTQSLYTSTNSITISGLSPGTSYKIQLRAACSSSCYSDWSSSSSCVTTSVPVITFSASVPTNVTYITNQSLPITWTSSGLSSSDKVQLELWTCNGTLQTVLFPGDGTSNTGSVNWTIPSSVPSGSYKIKIYKFGCTSNCASAFSSCISIVLPNDGGLRVNGGITANVYPTSAGNGVLQTCQDKSISFSLTNTKNIAINRRVILFMYNTSTGNAEPAWVQQLTLNPGQTVSFDRTSQGLSGNVNSAAGNYQLELQATENDGINFSYNTANRVPAVTGGTNPLNITVTNGCGGLRLTSGINATTYPTSSGANILKKCVEKNINFILKNTTNTTIIRAVKLWMVNSAGTTDLVWKKALTLTAGQTITFTRNEVGLGEAVTKDPGTYRLVMQAVDGGEAALGFSYNTANNVPGEGGKNDITVQVNDGCPTLTVTSPVLNQVFNCGTSATISWTTTNLASSANMAIELVNTTAPNTTVYVIKDGTPNSGSFTWSIPSTLPVAITPGNYKIKVYQVGSTNIPVNLSPTFSISCQQPITFSFTSPANTTYNTGQALPISWTSSGLSSSDKVQLELWTCNGTLQTVLFPDVGNSNTGSASWTIPSSVPSGSYKIKIYKFGCSSTSNCVSEFSSCFTVNNTTTNPTLTVTSPTLNQVLNFGTSATISWTTTNLAASANMAIELVDTSTPNSIVYQITNGTLNSGSYSWSIPLSLKSVITPGNYKIKIYQVETGIPVNLSPTIYIKSQQAEMEILNFVNKNLEASVKYQLGISQSSSITQAIADTVTMLDFHGLNLSNISDLTKFPNLNWVNLTANGLYSICELKNLKHLSNINCNNNQLTSIDCLNDFESPTLYISVKFNNITSFDKVLNTLFPKIVIYGQNEQLKSNIFVFNQIYEFTASVPDNTQKVGKIYYRCFSPNSTKATLNLGDGTSLLVNADGIGQYVQHTYSAYQNYTVTLTCGSETKSASVNLGSVTPVDPPVVYEPQSITQKALSTYSYYSGTKINLPYTLNGTWDPNTILIAELSDAQGSFISPIQLVYKNTNISDTLKSVIPSSIPSGNSYKLRISNLDGSIISNISNSINISAALTPEISIKANNTIQCSNTATSFIATGKNLGTNPTYQWYLNGVAVGINSNSYSAILNNGDVVQLKATINETNVTQSEVFSSTQYITVVNQPETPIIVQFDSILVSSALEGNQWYKDNQPLQGAVNQFYSPVESGEYFVIVNATPCATVSSPIYIYTSNSDISGVKNLTVPGINIYPNPAKSEFTITDLDNSIKYRYILYDIAGKQYIKNEISYLNYQKINVEKIPVGNYILLLYNADSNNLVGLEKVIKRD